MTTSFWYDQPIMAVSEGLGIKKSLLGAQADDVASKYKRPILDGASSLSGAAFGSFSLHMDRRILFEACT
jgi:hypothetical protein